VNEIDLKAAATWSLLCEPGDSMAGMLRRVIGIEESLFEIRRAKSAKDILPLLQNDHFRAPQFVSTLEESLECWQRRLSTVNVDKSLDVFFSLGGFLVSAQSRDWPVGLIDLGDSAPAVIWAIGNRDVLQNQKTVSLVGARTSSAYGLEVTRDLARAAVSNDFIVVSGGALGIDAQAHKSTLDAGGQTIAVMAGGLNRLYPSKNLDLFEEIKQSGLLVSEMPPGTSPARWRFLQRKNLSY
jgi:DNA processing protein